MHNYEKNAQGFPDSVAKDSLWSKSQASIGNFIAVLAHFFSLPKYQAYL